MLAAAEVMLRRSCSKEALEAVPVRLTDMARNQKARHIAHIASILGLSNADMSLSACCYR